MTEPAAQRTALEVSVSHVGRRAVIGARGEIDIATAPVLTEAISGALRAGALEIWIDLGPTRFMDSMGLSALLRVRRRLEDSSRRLAIVCPPGRVRRVFELAGVDAVLPLHVDLATAQRAA